MKKDIVQRLTTFSDSDLNSEKEQDFMAQELQGYFDKKLKQQYAEKLNNKFGIKKESGGRTQTKKNTSINRRLLMLAATLLIIAAAFQFFSSGNENSGETMMAYKAELYSPIDANVRGNLTDHQQIINELASAYEEKDFNRVITNYEQLKATSISFDMNIEQMAGVAYGSIGNYQKAIFIFNSILAKPESNYSNHSTVRYLLGLVHLLNNDDVQAKLIFDKIRLGDFKYNAVQKILRTI